MTPHHLQRWRGLEGYPRCPQLRSDQYPGPLQVIAPESRSTVSAVHTHDRKTDTWDFLTDVSLIQLPLDYIQRNKFKEGRTATVA